MDEQVLENANPTWSFVAKNFFGERVTDVTARGNLLDVYSYKLIRVIIALNTNEHRETIDINDISEIVYKKSTSYLSVFLIFASIVFISQGDLWSILLLLFGLFTLRTRNMYIYHKHGMIKVPDEVAVGNNVDDFLNYVRAYNPDCVKVIIDN